MTAVLEDTVETLVALRQMFPIVSIPDDDLHAGNEHVCEERNECHFLFPEDLNIIPEGFAEHIREFQKLKEERAYLEEVMKKLLKELQTDGKYFTLIEVLEKERLRKLENVQTHLKGEVTKSKRKRLRGALGQSRTSKQEEIEQMQDAVSYLKVRLAEAKVKNAMAEKYTEKQCQAQLEQKKIMYEEKEAQGKKNLEKIALQLEEEERAHVEIEFFLNGQDKEFLNKLDEWKNKYLIGIQELDKKIEDTTAEKIKNRNRYLDLRQECDRQKQVIEEDRQQKEAIRLQLEKELKERQSVTLIQSWWRAVMVRKFLGEYKGLKKIMKKSKSTIKLKETKEKASDKKNKQELPKKTGKSKKK